MPRTASVCLMFLIYGDIWRLSKEVSSLPLGSKVVITSQPVIPGSWMLPYRAIIISPSPPLRRRRTDGANLEHIDLLSCSHKMVRRCLAGLSVGQLLSPENGNEKLWLGRLQVSAVVMVLPLRNVFFGTTVWEGLYKIPTLHCHSRDKMSTSYCLQAEKGKKERVQQYFLTCE